MTMSKKPSQAERCRRKLRKREERRRRSRRSRHEPWTRSESVDEAQRRAMLMKGAKMMQQFPPCSEALAEDFTSEAEVVSEHLGSVAASGRRALEQWPRGAPDAGAAHVAADIVDAAESDGHRWEVLARRFETLAQGE